nr:ribonuclease H-like domain-containing protein [Tanacetum cinerariifolium]
KRTRRVKENLHVEFLENKAIEQGASPNCLFDIDSLTKSMNYVPVDAGINSTNLSVSFMKKAALKFLKAVETPIPLLLHSIPRLMESPIPTVSSPVPTACLNDSTESSSEARLFSKRVANQEETPSLDNILSLTNRFEDILGVSTSLDEIIGVEADVSNMETSISASPNPTLKIHKDHPKSQINGHVDTSIHTRNKSKMVEEQSFMATIHQKTDLALL